MPLININHLRTIAKAIRDRVPQKAAESAQKAAAEATKQAKNAASSSKSAAESARQVADQVSSSQKAISSASDEALRIVSSSTENIKSAEQDAEEAAANAEAWAESANSPDNANDTDSTTGKTQSAKSWAVYAKQQADEVKEAYSKISAPEDVIKKIYIGDEEQAADENKVVALKEMSDEDIDNIFNMLILTNDKYEMADIYPDTFETMTSVKDPIDASELNTARDMFCGCAAIKKIPEIDTSHVVDMSGMFEECSSITSIPQIDTSNVTNMYYMFFHCAALVSIPWEIDMKSCTSYNNMFSGCDKLTGVKLKNVPKDFNAATAGLKDGQYTIVSYRA